MAIGCIRCQSNPVCVISGNSIAIRQKMKIGKLIFGALALLLIMGFVYLLIADVPIPQTEKTLEIPHDRPAQ